MSPQLRGRWASRWARRSAGSCGGSRRCVRPSEVCSYRTAPSSSSDRASHSLQFRWPCAPNRPGWCQLGEKRRGDMFTVFLQPVFHIFCTSAIIFLMHVKFSHKKTTAVCTVTPFISTQHLLQHMCRSLLSLLSNLFKHVWDIKRLIQLLNKWKCQWSATGYHMDRTQHRLVFDFTSLFFPLLKCFVHLCVFHHMKLKLSIQNYDDVKQRRLASNGHIFNWVTDLIKKINWSGNSLIQLSNNKSHPMVTFERRMMKSLGQLKPESQSGGDQWRVSLQQQVKRQAESGLMNLQMDTRVTWLQKEHRCPTPSASYGTQA